MIGAPPPIICQLAAGAVLMCFIILLPFSCFACSYKWLPQSKTEVDISCQQFVSMSGLQILTLIKRIFKSPYSSKSENFRPTGFDF